MVGSAYSNDAKVSRRSSSGFTLLEILVAFVMMALVIGTLLRLYGTAMRNVALSSEYSYAIQVAESRLELVGTAIPVEEGSSSGEEKGTGYRWVIRISPIELDEEQELLSLPIQPYQVVVTVSWPNDNGQGEFSLSSLRFGERT